MKTLTTTQIRDRIVNRIVKFEGIEFGFDSTEARKARKEDLKEFDTADLIDLLCEVSFNQGVIASFS